MVLDLYFFSLSTVAGEAQSAWLLAASSTGEATRISLLFLGLPLLLPWLLFSFLNPSILEIHHAALFPYSESDWLH